MLLPGTVIDELYEIQGPIGKGGMAMVYAARRLDGGPEVAVKVLGVDGADRDELRRRFFRELLLATRVRHPNIVEVHDFGVMGSGAPYFVMERLHGVTLHRALREHGPMSEERVIRLFLGPLAALAEAHATGVVHRDLKPSNLFLRAQGGGGEDLVVLDFGIAHRLKGDERSCVEGTSATPRYAAPEYIVRREVRPELDVYQVGLVLAEALCGRPVVSSWDADECFRAHLRGPLVLPPEVMASGLFETIRRAVNPDHAQRHANAGELLEALQALDKGEAPPARRAPARTPEVLRPARTPEVLRPARTPEVLRPARTPEVLRPAPRLSVRETPPGLSLAAERFDGPPTEPSVESQAPHATALEPRPAAMARASRRSVSAPLLAAAVAVTVLAFLLMFVAAWLIERT